MPEKRKLLLFRLPLPRGGVLRRREALGLLADLRVIGRSVCAVACCLGSVTVVRVIQQLLHTDEDLLNCDGSVPRLRRVDDGEAHLAAAVNIRVVDHGLEARDGRCTWEILCEL